MNHYGLKMKLLTLHCRARYMTSGYETPPLRNESSIYDFMRNTAMALYFSLTSQPKVVYDGPFSRKEVARHTKADDAWIIVDEKVYNISG